jgi:hypothetical protein
MSYVNFICGKEKKVSVKKKVLKVNWQGRGGLDREMPRMDVYVT